MRRHPFWLLTAALAGCGGPHSAFADPVSPAADAIAWLWWVLFWVTLTVLLAVMVGWGYAVFRRRTAGYNVEPEGRAVRWILLAGAVIPAVILLGLTVATILTSQRIATDGGAADALVVELVGHQFWWEARYPESGAITANEIHIPADRPVRMRLSTRDVIHSFWIPRLHGKLDMTPGRTTELMLRAPEPGVYRGFCAEFCGTQHALMGIRVVAMPEDEFAAWAAHQASSAGEAASPAGERLFVAHECNLCHRVRGAPFDQPTEDVGPDLTHLASRETLGAITLENTSDNLAAWLLDPHRFKPGVRMPATPMAADQVDALVSYLEGLR